MSDLNNLLLLFERPTEPVFISKGPSKTVFDIPVNFLSDKYQPFGLQLSNRFEAENRVQVQNITVPDLTIPLQLPRRDNFSVFIPKHQQCAGKLIDIFMKARTTDDLTSTAVYCRDRVNPYLFNYALSVAMLHRNDTTTLPIPNFLETFPGKFLDSAVFARAREEATVVPEGSRPPIVIPRDYTATDVDPEHRVAYFREDIGINLHHWHWHLVYPYFAEDRSIVAKDRRGELFYYMHEQIVARYNFERLCNNMARVARFNNLKELIPEGYFPKMDSLISSRAWPPRFINVGLSDINRPNDGLSVRLTDLDTWRESFLNAIQQGFVTDTSGQRMPLNERDGIDILGNIMESSILNVNPNMYGDYHNMGHVAIAMCHDPDNRFLESFAVMGDSATAMRDPIFYRWHANIDEMFQQHKTRLPQYTVERLSLPNVEINSVQLETQGSSADTFQTFWQQSDVDLSRGLDFAPRGSVFARFTHLQHQPFRYMIRVTNSSDRSQIGTVRIFLGPRLNERGQPFTFNEQRLLMIELDKFRVNLRPGQNMIIRTSVESSVTIPYERTFRNLTTNRPTDTQGQNLATFNFCGCGWPQHMLIPKGNTQGSPADLFVMISNFANDRINQDVSGLCNDADSYCGIRNKLYPDRQSMGFPFDRIARSGVTNLANFLTPNMAVRPVTIQFTDRTEIREPTRNDSTTGAPTVPTTGV